MKISRNKLKEIIRETLTENKEYERFFQTALNRAGKSIPDMSDDEKKSFFNKIDTAWNGRGEKKEVDECDDCQTTVTETIKEDVSNDDTLMIKIGGEQGKYWPWYFKKIDSTHFKMANTEKAVSTGAAMVHHVGQHRGEAYYQSLVDWLHGKLTTKKLNGKKFNGNG